MKEEFFKNDIIQQFKMWLHRNNYYYPYATEVQRRYYKWVPETRVPYVTNVAIRQWILSHIERHPRELINCTLSWAETPQGYQYWLKVDGAWRVYCKKNNLHGKPS